MHDYVNESAHNNNYGAIGMPCGRVDGMFAQADQWIKVCKNLSPWKRIAWKPSGLEEPVSAHDQHIRKDDEDVDVDMVVYCWRDIRERL
jgi:hypothetical protein